MNTVKEKTIRIPLIHEEDIGRRERTIANAEAMKFQLKEQLTLSQQEAERNFLKFKRFAERADVGIFILGMDGVYSYRNEAWFDILGTVEDHVGLDEAWDLLIDEDYREIGQTKFKELIETKQHQ